MSSSNVVYNTARVYADNRIFQLSKGNHRFKINARELKQELINAAVFGELSGYERIMAEMVSDKDMSREDIEAKLHLAIVELYNFMRQKFDLGPAPMKLEHYLDLRGYFNKDKQNAASLVVEQ
jgi:hypothetical protein